MGNLLRKQTVEAPAKAVEKPSVGPWVGVISYNECDKMGCREMMPVWNSRSLEEG